MAEAPVLEVAPADIGLTRLPTYFWLAREPRTVEATAEVPGLRVTAQARPSEYVWDLGNGKALATRGIGRPWSRSRPGSISHTYAKRGTYSVTTTVVWHGRWRVDGGPWMHLGYFTTSDSRSYPVRQMRAVLTRSKH